MKRLGVLLMTAALLTFVQGLKVQGQDGKGLLTQDDILAYSKKMMGDKPFADSVRREKVLNHIRDWIKSQGTDFQYSAIGPFADKMHAQGTHSVHIGYAISANYGTHPKLADYFGTYHLRTANRGNKSVKNIGGKLYTVIQDDQHESGKLTINPDGTYVWEYLRGDAPEKWNKGKWRQAQPEELHLWEGGPAIWLLNAKQGYDYMVRMNREHGWTGWIDVGAGKGRTPIEYGRKP